MSTFQELSDYLPDEHFIWYTYEMCLSGDKRWPPSIISYYGHPIPIPDVHIEYIGRSRRFLKCLVIFIRRTINPSTGLLTQTQDIIVPAWQGDNNIIHLMNPLPKEDEYDIDVTQFFETDSEIDIDYFNRLKEFYVES